MQELSREQVQKQFEALFEMFSTEGWKIFQEEFKNQLDSFTENAPDVCTTNDQWQYIRGQIHKMRQIVGYQQFVEAQYEQFEEFEDENASDV